MIVARLSRLAGAAAIALGTLLAACAQDNAGDDRAMADPGVSGPAATTASNPNTTAGADDRPNILLIVADDLGFADVGFNGSEIPTPNIDALAAAGMQMTNFYTGLACSPTRAMLLSGVDNHLAGLGVMNGPTRDDHQNVPGYVGHMNHRVASMAALLSDAGYDTYMTGKWHLGADIETGPRARGFRRSFVSLDGAAHLGPWDWRGPQPAEYRDGDKLVHVDDDFYSTRFYTDRMLDYIELDRDDGRPFFAYLAYTAPHWPLQAPAESIERFRGRYDAGFEALYHQRLNRQRELGIVPANLPAIPDERFNPRWADMPDEERAFAARRMEIYAAMVSDLDTHIGRVVEYLRAIDEFDDTLIMFISDNGAESNRRDLAPDIQAHVGVEYDHSLDNLGSATSYVMYGRNWASASATPFARHKATAFEGGIHVPAFVHYPARVDGGTKSAIVATVVDLLPTFLDIAGAEHPGDRYRGREVLPPQGSSLLPAWYENDDSVRSVDAIFGWELYGHRSIRQGDWKITWDRAAPEAERRWQLFNLADDPFEQQDLAVSQPQVFRRMLAAWDEYEATNAIIY